MSALPLHVFNPFAVLTTGRQSSTKASFSALKQSNTQPSSNTKKRRRTSPVTPIFHAHTLREINRVREGRRVDQIFAQNTITTR